MPAHHPAPGPDQDTTDQDTSVEAEVRVLHGTPNPTPTANRDVYAATLSKARSNALTMLRRDHRGDYDNLVRDYMNSAGFEYTPPLTPAQRASEKIRQLADAHGLQVTLDDSIDADT